MTRGETKSGGKLRLAMVVAASLCAIGMMAGPAAHAQTFTVLHSFTGGADGANPTAGLTIDQGGHLYGTTADGGNSSSDCGDGCGVVFKMSHQGSSWILSPIYSFHGNGPDGQGPNSRVVFGPDGALYGTAALVFKLTPPASICKSVSCSWTETILFPYCCIAYSGDLSFDQAGKMYGTSDIFGIINRCSGGLGCGFVYQMTATPGGQYWIESDLYDFMDGSGLTHPTSGVILDAAGNLYGTTSDLFSEGWGAVFELSPSPSGGWTETTLYSFHNQSDGKYPQAGLAFDAAGNLYGAASAGGNAGGGTVFQLTPGNGGWNFNLLASLSGSSPETPGPYAALIRDGAGNLYGTTYADGAYGMGSVFKLALSNGNWTYTTLYDFTGGSDGANPEGGLVMDADGNLYGTTFAGGAAGGHCSASGYTCGVVFEITP